MTLYDLWAMAEAGHVTPEAALVYKRHGPTNSFPRTSALPKQPPSIDEWFDAVGHQCIPMVGRDEAFETVVAAWESATADAEARGLR